MQIFVEIVEIFTEVIQVHAEILVELVRVESAYFGILRENSENSRK